MEPVDIATMKLYLSSMNGRSCKFVYFNLSSEYLVLANSQTSPKKGYEDRVIDFRVGELSVHVISFKDREFVNRMTKWLNIPDGVVYTVNIAKVLSAVGKSQYAEVVRDDSLFGDGELTIAGERVGYALTDMHVLTEFKKFTDSVQLVGTPEHRKQFVPYEFSIPSTVTLTGRIFFLTVELARYLDATGNVVFSGKIPTINILCLSGLNTAAIKEFIMRLAGEYSHTMYSWAVRKDYIQYVTLFENADISAKIIRPHLVMIPLPDTEMDDSLIVSLK